MEKFFVVISRINQVLLLLVLLAGAGFIAWGIWDESGVKHRGAVKVAATPSAGKAPLLMKFDGVEGVAGTDVIMIRLRSEEGATRSYSSGGGVSNVRNLLFVSHSDKAGHWLFKDHTHLIRSVEQLSYDPQNSAREAPARALYLEYVAADSNHDGELTPDDDTTVAVSRPDGTGLTEVLHGARNVLSYQMTDPQHLSVLYQVGEQVKHLSYSLATMKVESDQALAEVPNRL